MISVEQAKLLVKENVQTLSIKEVEVIDALGCHLAESIIAPISIPSFNQSAMDGYAFSFEFKNGSLNIVNEVSAGNIDLIRLNSNEAVRIFTGSKVPDDCDTVVMQELVEKVDKKITINDEYLKLGGNIRLKGSQIEKGEIALEPETKITAAGIGFLSALGITKIKVYQSPKVAIIATGNELVKPGSQLKDGQIFESNTFMLKAALNKLNIEPEIILVKDDKERTQEAISNAISKNNLVLLSGGISVGDYDFVKEALGLNKVEQVFYKVKQKPGKPLYFGKTSNCYVIALPGNPAAALTCFYQYVFMTIQIMTGERDVGLKNLHVRITNSLVKKGGRAVFYKAHTDYKKVTILEGQGSDMLKSFALANCFAYLPEEITNVDENDMIEIHLIP